MIFGLGIGVAIGCVAVVFVGSVLQASIGIGLGMVSAPVLALVDPDFVPGAVVISVVPLSLAVAAAERDHIERRGIGWAILGRVPGVAVGAIVAAWLSEDLLAALVAVSVLVAVAATASDRRFEPTDGHLAVAGAVSGFTGTTTGVGGPPMAITYQHADPAVMRSSLAAFFTVGSLMSIIALVAAGVMTGRQWQLALLVLPGVLLGAEAARRSKHRLRPGFIRPAVLGVCTLSSLALLVRALA